MIPAGHIVQLVDPPVEYDPEGHGSIDVDEVVGQ